MEYVRFLELTFIIKLLNFYLNLKHVMTLRSYHSNLAHKNQFPFLFSIETQSQSRLPLRAALPSKFSKIHAFIPYFQSQFLKRDHVKPLGHPISIHATYPLASPNHRNFSSNGARASFLRQGIRMLETWYAPISRPLASR